MKTENKQSGFILLLTVVLVFATALVAIGIMSIAKDVNNSEQMWTDNDDCYMMAQSIVGRTRADVYNDFEQYFLDNNSNTSVLDDWFDDHYEIGTYLYTDATLTEMDSTGDNGTYPTEWVENATFTVLIKDKQLSSDSSYVDMVTEVTVTMGDIVRRFEEKFRVKMESRVFEYAYFINNKGWLFGSTLTVNGKMRANGDILLSGNPTINGEIYASWNNSLRRENGSLVKGDILDQNESGIGSFISQSGADYDAAWLTAAEMAAGVPVSSSNPAFVRDYVTDPDNVEFSYLYNPYLMEDGDTHLDANINQDPLNMPFLGDLQPYIDSSEQLASSGWGRLEFVDQNGVKRVIDDGHFGDDEWEQAGPDGVIGTVDDGTLIITGDFSIMGSLVVDGDLIIAGNYGPIDGFTGSDSELSDTEISDLLQGVEGAEDMSDSERKAKALEIKSEIVNGKGSIYAGRNIHVVGDLAAATSSFTDIDLAPFMSLSSKGSIVLGNLSDGGKDYSNLQYMVTDDLNSAGLMEPYATDDESFQNTTISYVDESGNTVTTEAFDGNYVNFESDSFDALQDLKTSSDYSKVIPLGTEVRSKYDKKWPQKTETVITEKYKKCHAPDCPTATKKQKKCPVPSQYHCKTCGGSASTSSQKFDSYCYHDHSGAVVTAVGGGDDYPVDEDCCNRVKHYYDVEETIEVDDKTQNPYYVRDDSRFIIMGYDGDKNLDATQRFFSDNMSDQLNDGQFPVNIDGEIYSIADMLNSPKNYFTDEDGTKESGVLVAVTNDKLIKPGESFKELKAYHAKMYNLPAVADQYMPSISDPKRVDAVLYTNHLFGGRMKNNGAVNGAVVARDEALKFKGNGFGSFNWDQRLARTSNEPGAASAMQDFLSAIMPKTFDPTYDPNNDIIQYWREIPVN